MTIKEIAARWAAATPGPWRELGPNEDDGGRFYSIHGTEWRVAVVRDPDDSAAIAAAPADIAYLLSLLTRERLASALDKLEPYWFEDALHGASGWNMAAAILAALEVGSEH